eukprot:SAG22_NODE_21143_length_259_cov_1.237500_1_plen_33_part_01
MYQYQTSAMPRPVDRRQSSEAAVEASAAPAAAA